MFTGLIQRLGTLSSLSRSGSGAALTVAVPEPWPDPLVIGESIAVQGACLTVSRVLPTGFVADVLEETLDCTALSALCLGARLNLERALAVGDRLGGHIVQGHVDALGRVVSIRPRGRDQILRVGTDSAILRPIVYKGSIAIPATPSILRRISSGSTSSACWQCRGVGGPPAVSPSPSSSPWISREGLASLAALEF